MGEMKHTPGPWRVGKGGPNGCPTVGTHQGLMVCMVAHTINLPSQADTARADAAMLAAAPSMQATLIAMDKFWSEEFPEGPEQEQAMRLFNDETIAMWRRIRKTIALSKAEGRSLSSASGQEGRDHG